MYLEYVTIKVYAECSSVILERKNIPVRSCFDLNMSSDSAIYKYKLHASHVGMYNQKLSYL